jgi:hypothetical protein
MNETTLIILNKVLNNYKLDYKQDVKYLYYIHKLCYTGGPARHKKVSAKTWRILHHFHDNTYFILMVTATGQPRS